MTTSQARTIARTMFRGVNVRRVNGECQIVRRHVIHTDAVEVLGKGPTWAKAIDRAFDRELDDLADAFGE